MGGERRKSSPLIIFPTFIHVKNQKKEGRVMKRLMVTGALMLSMIFTLGYASNAAAFGWAGGLLINTASGSMVVLTDFDDFQYTQASANKWMSNVSIGATFFKSSLGAQFQNATITVFTPSQMTTFGLGDADAAHAFILENLAALNVDLYARAFVTIVAPPEGSGTEKQNYRLDFYLYDGSGVEIGYVGSVEISHQLTSLLGGIISL
jgi:hypothetical protein